MARPTSCPRIGDPRMQRLQVFQRIHQERDLLGDELALRLCGRRTSPGLHQHELVVLMRDRST